jgi:hypothetical protein
MSFGKFAVVAVGVGMGILGLSPPSAQAQVGTLTTNQFAGAVNDSGIIAAVHVNAFYNALPYLVSIIIVLFVIGLMRRKAGK